MNGQNAGLTQVRLSAEDEGRDVMNGQSAALTQGMQIDVYAS